MEKIARCLCIMLIIIGCQPQPKEEKLPNIVYILADDLGYGDLSCYGQSNFSTPNIDKLAQNGMLFTQHYSGSTVCAPSRSSLLTGLHTGHTFIRGNNEVLPEGQYPLISSETTIAELLKKAGYKTGAFGKWGLGYPGSEGDPNNQGFDVFHGYNCQRYGHHYYPHHLWHNQERKIVEENNESNTGIYGPDIIHKEALQFIEENKDNPFFLYYPSIIPHAELLAPESYVKKFRGKFNPEKEYKGVDEGEGYRTGDYGSQKESHATFAAMITILDEQVGEIVSKLNDMGLSDNTIIIFTSDNGPHQEGGADPDYFDSNGQLRGYKRDLYEGGIRVPMIASWPNTIKSGSTSDHVSTFWDFLPTVCEIAKVNTSEDVDGISFLPELLNKKQTKHKALYWEFHEQGGKQAVRYGQWKGIRLNMQKNPNAPIALYDLTNDIGEQHNIEDQHPKIIKIMDSIMKTEHQHSKEFSFDYEKLQVISEEPEK